MSRLINILFLSALALSVSFSMTSCNGAKSYVKKAKKMEEAGMIDQAATHFFTALRKKPDNLDALTGMKRTGQIVLSKHLADFDEAVLRNDREAAISSFQKAEAYEKKIASVNVTLVFPQAKRDQFVAVKNAHVEEIYGEATEFLNGLNYDEALTLFERIEELVPGFKDAKALGDYSYCKPKYDLGNNAFDQGHFRTAYESFNNVVNRDANFEDAGARKQEALDAGRYTIALMKFDNGSSRRNVHTKLSSYVEQKLMNSQDPFLTVVDRESLELILQEQHLELSGLTSGTELEIGSLLGAKAILKGTVVDCNYNQTSMHHQNKQGYERYRVEAINSEGKKYYETKYRQVWYAEYNQSSTVTVTFNLKLISMETGTVLKSETVSATNSDNIRFINYSGNKQMLYPARINGGVDSSTSGHNSLVQLSNARRDLKDDDLMINECAQAVAGKVQSEVEAILKEQIK